MLGISVMDGFYHKIFIIIYKTYLKILRLKIYFKIPIKIEWSRKKKSQFL